MIDYLILDVDGTLTDGGIYYDNNGNELKKFCTRDGAGFAIGRAAGIKFVVITGRECEATRRRMKELHVDYVYQNIKDKVVFLKSWMEENGVRKEQVGYIGDDINDLSSMNLCSFIGCPADACEDIRLIANYVSKVNGGYGAVRDVIEYYLKENGIWMEMVDKTFGCAGV